MKALLNQRNIPNISKLFPLHTRYLSFFLFLSEGEKQAKINVAEGDKQELIKRSEGEKQRRINEAEGKAAEIEAIAIATANGIRQIANAINDKGGKDAVNLRIAEQYLLEFGKLASTNTSMIIPTNLADISGIIATATSVFQNVNKTKE